MEICDKKISLLAFDLDGTLINSAGQLCPSTLTRLRKLQENGVKVTICSGRMPYSLKKYCHQLGIDGPIVAGNGALVVHCQTAETYFANSLPSQEVADLLAVLKGKGFHVNIQTQGSVYFSREYLDRDTPVELSELYGLPLSHIRFMTTDYTYPGKDLVYKATVRIPAGGDFTTVERYLKSRRELDLTFSRKDFAEINSKGINKGKGLQRLADYYGIPLTQVCAFGDYDNDIPCFELAGISVAMGNASDRLKDMATLITDTNDNEGIAKALATLAPCFFNQ